MQSTLNQYSWMETCEGLSDGYIAVSFFFLPQTIHAELSKLVKKYSERRGEEQAMYKKMLGTTCSNSDQDRQAKSWVTIWFISFFSSKILCAWPEDYASPTLPPLLLPGPQLEVAVQCRCRGHRRHSFICLHRCQELSRVHCDDVTIPQQRNERGAEPQEHVWKCLLNSGQRCYKLSSLLCLRTSTVCNSDVMDSGLSLLLPHTLFHSCYFDPHLLILGLS